MDHEKLLLEIRGKYGIPENDPMLAVLECITRSQQGGDVGADVTTALGEFRTVKGDAEQLLRKSAENILAQARVRIRDRLALIGSGAICSAVLLIGSAVLFTPFWQTTVLARTGVGVTVDTLRSKSRITISGRITDAWHQGNQVQIEVLR
jgi:hypothetical protein